MKKVNILGAEYTIIEDDTLSQVERDGEFRTYSKLIRIRPQRMMLDNECTENEQKAHYQRALRHELIHAIFERTGNDSYSENEELVDYLAIMFPEMQQIFWECGCLE